MNQSSPRIFTSLKRDRLLGSLVAFFGFTVVLAVGTPTVAAQEPMAEGVTFARDVAPILQANCEACHRPGSIGPMALMDYEQVRPWAPMIREKVSTRAMPPWPYDRTIGIQELKNDPSLTDEEIATIVAMGGFGCARRESRGSAGASGVAGVQRVLATRGAIRGARSYRADRALRRSCQRVRPVVLTQMLRSRGSRESGGFGRSRFDRARRRLRTCSTTGTQVSTR